MAKEKTKEIPKPDVSGIDYGNLTGDNWKSYKKIEESLLMHQHYDFEQVGARAINKKRFNEDTGVVEPYIAGIEVTSAKPLMLTRISARDARTLNDQVANTGKYFLISKTEK